MIIQNHCLLYSIFALIWEVPYPFFFTQKDPYERQIFLAREVGQEVIGSLIWKERSKEIPSVRLPEGKTIRKTL